MPIVQDEMKDRITLHGLGFIQVQLGGQCRLHVWHPDLPRRTCFEHSAIHDHRFGFESRVLVGIQRNIEYAHTENPDGTHITYLHEGPRTPRGGRPWVPDGRINLTVSRDHLIAPGQIYTVPPYLYHRTEPAGDGMVATLMRKTVELERGAHSTCLATVQPDDDFDRFQWTPRQLWEVVNEVMGSGIVVAA